MESVENSMLSTVIFRLSYDVLSRLPWFYGLHNTPKYPVTVKLRHRPQLRNPERISPKKFRTCGKTLSMDRCLPGLTKIFC